MTIAHNLGFPRIGAKRELKKALESHWQGKLSAEELRKTGRTLRERHWRLQAEAGLDLLPAGDFSWYDSMLDMTCLLGCIPPRFGRVQDEVDLATYFRMARGRASDGEAVKPCEMTKWFDTNYHYIVPEIAPDQSFRLASNKLFEEVSEAKALGFKVKPVLIGPISWLWLSKTRGESLDPSAGDEHKLAVLENLWPVYREILQEFKAQGVEWVQIDEPVLCLDLPCRWRQAFEGTYSRLQVKGLNILLASYFGALGNNLNLACNLPVEGLHIDLARAPEQLIQVQDWLPVHKVLSAGLIDGRNVWRADLDRLIEQLRPLQNRFEERLWLAPSCSLLHVPVDLNQEHRLDDELKSWLAFAVQKLEEVAILKQALDLGTEAVGEPLAAARAALESRRKSARLNQLAVRERMNRVDEDQYRRCQDYPARAKAQRDKLKLPLLPTTTIGSFPQTGEIRAARRAFKAGELSKEDYQAQMKQAIAFAVRQQIAYDLDVLVHGEAERSDMVEYFAEQLDGFAITQHGWVQSYGSRCVKPPILYGDVARNRSMTVEWSRYAQSLTDKPMKGMLTGPVTHLQWSFVRDDQPRADTCLQIALALRDEVVELEKAGIGIIQIDEPALREGLPLRQQHWEEYLDWAVRCFRLASSAVQDDTQIHTHMCYAEFNDIIEAIAKLDADVITIEASRSDMDLLDAFVNFHYPNEIGPGVYDIHSPNVPTAEDMVALLRKALERIPAERLWVNPDCGLKTRRWEEVDEALKQMVRAAKQLRKELAARAD